MTTMEGLVRGRYELAARLVEDGDADAAWALYLRATEPLLLLRDLLGHASSLTTEVYLSRLDMTRIFKDVYQRSGQRHGQLEESEAQLEAEAEFDDEGDI